MSKRLKPKTYAQEKKLWYDKLKASGFEDIETPEGFLKQNSASKFLSKKAIRSEGRSKEEYYYMATKFLHDYKFENEMEKVIWEYHANGISYRDISKLMKEVYKNKFREDFNLLIKEFRQKKITDSQLHKKLKKLRLRAGSVNTIRFMINNLEEQMKIMYIQGYK